MNVVSYDLMDDCVSNPADYTAGNYSESALNYGCNEDATEWFEENQRTLMWISLVASAITVGVCFDCVELLNLRTF